MLQDLAKRCGPYIGEIDIWWRGGGGAGSSGGAIPEKN